MYIKRARNFERAYVTFEDTVKDVDVILMPIINKFIGQKPTNKKVWSYIVEALAQLHLNKKLEIIFLEQYYFFYLDKINQLNEV